MIRVTRVVSTLAVVLAFLCVTSFAKATDTQYGSYGPSPIQSVIIDKMVNRPDNGSYVDNLSPSDPRFSPGHDVWFQLKVKNPNDQTLYGVTVKDFVPDFLDVLATPGSYNTDNRTITIDAGDFGGQQEKIYVIHARVVGSGSIPDNKGTFCLINRAQAYNSSVSDEDTAQFCVEKPTTTTSTTTTVTNVTRIPSTGPEMGLALIGLNMLGLSMGLYLRKKS